MALFGRLISIGLRYMKTVGGVIRKRKVNRRTDAEGHNIIYISCFSNGCIKHKL